MSLPYGGIDWVRIQKAMQRWVVGGTGLPPASVYWGQQEAPRVKEPAVEMRIYAEAELGQPWLDTEVNILELGTLTGTGASTAGSTLTFPAHGMVTGDGPIQFFVTGSGVLPAPLLPNVDYWVIVTDQDTIQVARTFFDTGGNFTGNTVTPMSLTATGTLPYFLQSSVHTRRAGEELLYVARAMERCTLALECHTSKGVGMDMAMSVLHGVSGRHRLPSQQAILQDANIGVQEVERVRAIHGIKNAIQFEPRAILQVHLSITSEASETGTIIQRVKGQNLITGKPFQVP